VRCGLGEGDGVARGGPELSDSDGVTRPAAVMMVWSTTPILSLLRADPPQASRKAFPAY
jgi:hypothetical protein